MAGAQVFPKASPRRTALHTRLGGWKGCELTVAWWLVGEGVSLYQTQILTKTTSFCLSWCGPRGAALPGDKKKHWYQVLSVIC